MKLHGTIAENLRSAVASAERLRGRRVYSDTILFWQALLDEAARTDAENAEHASIRMLMDKLAGEIAAHAPAQSSQ